MEQHRFIFLTNNIHPENITQDPDGNVTVILKDDIKIIHSYPGNKMKLYIGKNNVYILKDQSELEAVFRLYLENESLYSVLYEYASKNFKLEETKNG